MFCFPVKIIMFLPFLVFCCCGCGGGGGAAAAAAAAVLVGLYSC